MKKFTRRELEAMSLAELLVMLNPDFSIGSTHFPTPVSEDGDLLPNPKRWVIQHNYILIAEVNCEEDNVEEWETFGYPVETLTEVKTGQVFGSNPKETLIKFYLNYPHLIL